MGRGTRINNERAGVGVGPCGIAHGGGGGVVRTQTVGKKGFGRKEGAHFQCRGGVTIKKGESGARTGVRLRECEEGVVQRGSKHIHLQSGGEAATVGILKRSYGGRSRPGGEAGREVRGVRK